MPQSSGLPLVDRIERLTVPHGQLALWALGQAGFILKGGQTIVCIDPYLSDSITEIEGPKRRVPLPFAPGALRAANLVFATHEHLDHADSQTLGPLMAASAGARLITSLQGRDVALGAG
ncbi:MAG TPA: MBL fold metallo-hydrolase, partial [Anaerolineales bacterium]|nr:MBL fold metallo-hydrolase [Anaerolineales bacterium]